MAHVSGLVVVCSWNQVGRGRSAARCICESSVCAALLPKAGACLCPWLASAVRCPVTTDAESHGVLVPMCWDPRTLCAPVR